MARERNDRHPHGATVSLYGPNDQRASKMVAAVFKAGSDDIIDMQRWVSGRTDVRHDEKIKDQLRAFLKS